jgi:hypothetical protein
MFFFTRLYVATVYLKSGNLIVIRNIKSYTVNHTGGAPSSFEWKWSKPQKGDIFLDMDQVEAIDIKVQ